MNLVIEKSVQPIVVISMIQNLKIITFTDFSDSFSLVLYQAFEHLIAVEFVKSVDSLAKSTPKEYKLVTLLVDPSQINEAVQKYPDCPTEVRQWAMNAVVD